MTRVVRYGRSRRQRHLGASLIEVMVSLVIGLFVVGAVITNYLSTGAGGRLQSAISQMSEDAQIAFRMISRDLQMAGYTEVNTVLTSGVNQTATFTRPGGNFRPVFGCASTFVAPTAGFAAATCPVTTSTLHAIEVNYQTTTATSLVNSANEPTDCLGNSTNSTTQTGFTVGSTLSFTSNRYYVTTTSATGASRPELYCASPAAAGSGGQPLVENVQAMKIWYGEAANWNASDPTSRLAVRYVTANQVTSFNNVVSVRICLLMRTSEPVLTAEDSTFRYTNCDGVSGLSSTDGRIYRAFYSSIALRNRTGF